MNTGTLKYGELGRIKDNNLMYIVSSYKWNPDHLPFVAIPYISFSITKRTAKQERGNKLSKKDLSSCLLHKTFNLSIMRKVEKVIYDYLNKTKPEYIAISPYYDNNRDYERRIKFYIKRLDTMGYSVFIKDIKTYSNTIIYFKRGSNENL